MADLSPMMRQYFQIKKQNPNTLLFFRLGDFYELFYEDAKIASKELELTLTGKDCGQDERAPMCGVPFHSSESYIARLVAKGYKVAICEQLEDHSTEKRLVKRDVVRVITPGTVLEISMLDEGRNNFICSVCVDALEAGVCFADVSTGELHASTVTAESNKELKNMLKNELSKFLPKEVLINPDVLNLAGMLRFIKDKITLSLECLEKKQYEFSLCKSITLEHFKSENLQKLQLEGNLKITCAIGALLQYLKKTQKVGLENLNSISFYSDTQFMKLDINARRNLELLETLRSKEKKGSLLWVLDKTKTAMGKRMIRSWIEQPLAHLTPIHNRQNAVEELVTESILREELIEKISGIHDLERLMSRIVYGSANARELRTLWDALRRLPMVKDELLHTESKLLKKIHNQIDTLEDICALIDRSIFKDPPYAIRAGGIIREGYHKELDLIRDDMNNGKGLIVKIETEERQKTQIPKLKVGYNKVFGYYIEITNLYKKKVPAHYVRKQTLTNCERYITPELKNVEGRILGAHDKSIQMEVKIFDEIRKKVAAQLIRIRKTAAAIAQLDVLLSFAKISSAQAYIRPQINLDGKIIVKEGRHPVIELLVDDVPFVTNDILLDKSDNRVLIITGPNMAGKSTYMRQTALIVILAQIGCFVPAAFAEIGMVDGIFTRIGASDDLSAGQSTFMVEMTEVADILKNATANSLLILDEIGRGTSTFDGMSIARAVLEYVANKQCLGAKSLFATHYHELTELEEQVDGIKNYNIAVQKRGDKITFLRRIIRGRADDSFGIEVAKLAGVPDKVLVRAKQVLKQLEETALIVIKTRKMEEPENQRLLHSSKEKAVAARLRDLDLNTFTPIECMSTLFELSQMLK